MDEEEAKKKSDGDEEEGEPSSDKDEIAEGELERGNGAEPVKDEKKRDSEGRSVKDRTEKDKDRGGRGAKERESNRDREKRSSHRDSKLPDRDRKTSEKDRKGSDKDRKSSDRDRKISDKDKRRSRSRDRRRSGSRSRKRSSSRGRKSSDRRTPRKRSRSAGRRNDGKSRRSRSKKRSSRSRSKKRSSRSRSRKRSSRSSSKRRSSKSPKRSRSGESGDRPRSRSQELLDAAGRFDRSKKTKIRMKQHLLEQMNLLKIAKEQMAAGSQDSLRALSMQCMEIARKGLEEEAKAPQEEEAEASSEEEVENHDIILYVYATPSMMRITKSNANYKNILNNELEKYGKLGTCTGFWMTPHGYDQAYEKTIGDGMGGKAKTMYRPTGTSLLAIGYEGLVDYQKVYLPTTIKISTPSPEKWDKKGLVKTIFARASLYGDINIQDTNPHGKMHPPSASPTATGTAPAMTESSTDLVLFNPNQEAKGPYNPFSKEAKEWEKEKRRQALLEALLPGGASHPDSASPALENHHVPFNPFSKEAKEAERLKKEKEKEVKEKKKKKKAKEEEKTDADAASKAKNPFKKPPQFNPFLEGFRPSSYGYGEVRWTDEGPQDCSKLGNRFKSEQTTKYKL